MIFINIACQTTTNLGLSTPPEQYYPSAINTDKELLLSYQQVTMKISSWQDWYNINTRSNYFNYDEKEIKYFTSSDITKELNLKSEKQLHSILSNKKIIYKINDNWFLYPKYSGLGYMYSKLLKKNDNYIYENKWTAKGKDFIKNIIEGETNE